MQGKRFIGLAMAAYVFGLLFLVVALSHRPLFKPSPITVEVPPPTPIPDFAAISDTKAKKAAFFGYFTPIVDTENQTIMDERTQVIAIEQHLGQTSALTPALNEQLHSLMESYGVDADLPSIAAVEQLLNRVNTIPRALVLAQAANESAWGTSRFALEANNFFGQWCYRPGCGLVPSSRPEGAIHEVRKFASARDSVRSYLKNLNTHLAYAPLRDLRAEAIANHQPVTGHLLAKGLESYSERGMEYIEEIQAMIRINNLEPSPASAQPDLAAQ